MGNRAKELDEFEEFEVAVTPEMREQLSRLAGREVDGMEIAIAEFAIHLAHKIYRDEIAWYKRPFVNRKQFVTQTGFQIFTKMRAQYFKQQEWVENGDDSVLH